MVKDEDRLFLIANDFAKKLSDTILKEVVAALGISKYEEQEADQIWAEELRDIRTKKSGIPVEVMSILPKDPIATQKGAMDFEANGMHKRKGQKIEPVDDSGQTAREIEGRLDWKERAKAKQYPTEDPSRAPFAKYFEPRYAKFPRGTQITPKRRKEIKISPDLLLREIEMLKELLYRRESALA